MSSFAFLLRACALCLALVVTSQATGLVDACTGCTDACPFDDEQGHCPPTCTMCFCGAHRVTTAAPAAVAGAVRLLALCAAYTSWSEERALPDPTPDDILHVPRGLPV